MSKVLITGAADGLGREAAKQLVHGGHDVVLHARDEARAEQALAGVPGAAAALPGDLSSITSTRALADLINAAAGGFDAIIHNAGIGYREPTRRATEDGLEHIFQTNVLAPYLLTVLVNRPARLIYLSSGLHRSGDPDLADLHDTQVWLATSNDPLALQSGRHFYHRRPRETHPAVVDPVVQDGLLAACYGLTGLAITDSTGTTHAR